VTDIRSRIIGHGTADPADLLANPRNFRVHPHTQRTALAAAVNDIGWIAPVIVNQATGAVVDGHLRVAIALEAGEASIPVDYVELTDEEEGQALATLDPITAMATPNAHLFGQLLEHANTGEADLMAYLSDFAERIGVNADTTNSREQEGARELGSNEFSTFAHECPDCGFKFD
jgi:ParB-like chromosome segregation protein Spo0J